MTYHKIAALLTCVAIATAPVLAQSAPDAVITDPTGQYSLIPNTDGSLNVKTGPVSGIINANPDIPTGAAVLGAGSTSNPYQIPLNYGEGVTAISLSGLAASGATLQIQGIVTGATPVVLTATNPATNTLAPTNLTADGTYVVAGYGFNKLQIAVVVTGSGSITVATNSTSHGQPVSPLLLSGARVPTYSAYITGYVPYATAQDFFGICGNSKFAVKLTQMLVWGQSTTATQETISFLKRGTADTGGTPTSLTTLSWDSTNLAPSSVPFTFGAAPTAGTLVANFPGPTQNFTAFTAAPAVFVLFGGAGASQGGPTVAQQNFTLRGTGECEYANFGGGAVPGGTLLRLYVEWTEGPQ